MAQLLKICMLGLLVCFVSSASASGDLPCKQIEQDFKSSGFYVPNPLGTAGNFHLVGFFSVTTGTHTNGNILTDTLRYQSNFGTNGVKEVSYIRKIEFLSGGGFSSTYSSTDSLLVVGTGVQVGTADNGNAWTLNGHKVDAPMRSGHPASLMQDSDTLEYIDLQAVHDQTVRINQTLRTYENRLNKVIELTDGNRTFIQEVILSDPWGVNVCNITGVHAFKEDTSIKCKGFDKQTPGLLILNVDLAGVEEFLLPGTDLFYADGTIVTPRIICHSREEKGKGGKAWEVAGRNPMNKRVCGTSRDVGGRRMERGGRANYLSWDFWRVAEKAAFFVCAKKTGDALNARLTHYNARETRVSAF